MTMLKDYLVYIPLRVFGSMLSFLPLRVLHLLGKSVGYLIYHCHREFRKKTLTNLAIAYGTSLCEKEKRKIALKSFQSLTITCLELLYIKQSKIKRMAVLEENQEVLDLLNQKKGIVFLTAHQANWEIPFLAITRNFSGVAIGRPIKNRKLYQWILSRREMNLGKIIKPRNAIKEGVKALSKGEFVGIVGDQAFPESSYSYPFMGTRAWTTPMPALLAYKTGSPIVVATTKRVGSKYYISASKPIYPDQSKPLKEEIQHLMDRSLEYMEASIKRTPGQWLWQHDRWKQQGIDHVKRKYRFGFVLITLPKDPTPYLNSLKILRKIYSRSFLTLLMPKKTGLHLPEFSTFYYLEKEDLFIDDWRFQMVLDFYDDTALRRHFLKRGAFQALNIEKMKKISKKESLEEAILHTLSKPEYASREIL